MTHQTRLPRSTSKPDSEIDLDRGAIVFKALGDTSRLRILLALQTRELCVCQIVALIGMANSTISQHLSILRKAGLIESRKKGRWVYYRPAEKTLSPAYKQALDSMLGALAASDQGHSDETVLREILKQDPEQLCAVQLRG